MSTKPEIDIAEIKQDTFEYDSPTSGLIKKSPVKNAISAGLPMSRGVSDFKPCETGDGISQFSGRKSYGSNRVNRVSMIDQKKENVHLISTQNLHDERHLGENDAETVIVSDVEFNCEIKNPYGEQYEPQIDDEISPEAVKALNVKMIHELDPVKEAPECIRLIVKHLVEYEDTVLFRINEGLDNLLYNKHNLTLYSKDASNEAREHDPEIEFLTSVPDSDGYQIDLT